MGKKDQEHQQIGEEKQERAEAGYGLLTSLNDHLTPDERALLVIHQSYSVFAVTTALVIVSVPLGVLLAIGEPFMPLSLVPIVFPLVLVVVLIGKKRVLTDRRIIIVTHYVLGRVINEIPFDDIAAIDVQNSTLKIRRKSGGVNRVGPLQQPRFVKAAIDKRMLKFRRETTRQSTLPIVANG